jgi:hypothetical protein
MFVAHCWQIHSTPWSLSSRKRWMVQRVRAAHTDVQIPSILSNSFLDLCKCTEFRMVAWQITHQILQGFRDLHLAQVLKIYVMLLMYVSKETLMSQLCYGFWFLIFLFLDPEHLLLGTTRSASIVLHWSNLFRYTLRYLYMKTFYFKKLNWTVKTFQQKVDA